MLVRHRNSIYRRVEASKEVFYHCINTRIAVSSMKSRIPSWEEVWKEAKDFDSTNNREYSYMSEGDEDNPKDVALAAELVKEDVRDLYDTIVFLLVSPQHNLEGADCWRVIELPEEVNPATHPKLGVHWSYEKDAAQAQWGEGGQSIRYHARIDLENVDVPGIVLVNVDLSTGPEEKEVTFEDNAPIYVYDVELEDGTVVPIDDWRTT